MNKRILIGLGVLAIGALGLGVFWRSERSAEQEVLKVSCVGFYNVENLFDTINDPTKDDEQFLPEGKYAWTAAKYESKLERMAHVISQLGLATSPEGPAVMGLSEVENAQVLNDLVAQPAIKDRNYQVVHIEGPDPRGIDVGLIYNPQLFELENAVSHRFRGSDPEYLSRDLLCVSGQLQDEKVHFIVIHWPSRWGGEERSRPKRIEAALTTLGICDSIRTLDSEAKIMIMGDFNDDPFNESVMTTLNAKKTLAEVGEQGLYNALWHYLDEGVGSLCYRGKWNLFDMFILSEPLAKAEKGELGYWKGEIFNAPFLIQQEGDYKGYPWRTHAGGKWTNGYSDHLPVLVYLTKGQSVSSEK